MCKWKEISLLMVLNLFAFLGTALAGQFGAPEPVASSKNISLGIGYFYSSDKWELSSNSQDYKYSQNQVYLQLSAALNKIEFYIRGGAADLKFENAFPGGDFNDSYKLFGTIGARGIIDITPYLGIGLFGQGSLFSTYKSRSIEIKEFNEADVGAMLQAKISRICVYAGPFLNWTHAKTESSGNLKQTNNFGGVAGIRIPIYEGINVEIEGQYRQEFSAGAALTYSF